jgi:hypothetical protein
MSSERHGAEHLVAFTIEMSHSESSMGQRSLLLMGGMVDGRIRGKAEAEPCDEVVTTLNPTVSDLMQMSEAEQVPITRFEAKGFCLPLAEQNPLRKASVGPLRRQPMGPVPRGEDHIKLATWNIRSLNSKRQEIETFAEENGLGILAFQETWRTQDRWPLRLGKFRYLRPWPLG